MGKIKIILDRIRAVTATKKITQAMKMVSVSNLNKLKERKKKESAYIEDYTRLYDELTATMEVNALPVFFGERTVKRVIIICFTTERGLCGPFNQHVLKRASDAYTAYKSEGIDVDILPVGRKGFEFFHRKNIACITDYMEIKSDKSSEKLKEMIDFLSDAFEKEVYDMVRLVYQPSKVADKEKVRWVQLFPMIKPELSTHKDSDFYAYEASKGDIVATMTPHAMVLKLYKHWLTSTIAEESMRMLVTSQASENADKALKKLRCRYNKLRQSEITKSLSEIMAGMHAMD